MIYTILPEKDTYVTNRVINGFNCNKSNVGKAATLDIFKLSNETDEIKSWAILSIDTELPQASETFTLTDSDDNQVTFKFVANEDNVTHGTNITGEDAIKIGLGVTPLSPSALISDIALIINSVSSVTQNGPGGNLTLDVISKSSNVTIIIEQNQQGLSGDKLITQSASPKLKILKQFSRLEYSNVLIKFDLADLKDNVITNFSNSIFASKANFQAQIELIDVSTGHTKPFNYNLALYPLSKSFDEGLGKDTILFEDLDSSNFVTSSYDQTSNAYIKWGIDNFLVEDVDYYKENNGTLLTSNYTVKTGDENIVFDITEYIHQVLNNDIEDLGFLIRLGDSSLFDSQSYFVKRLGSKHLLNKKLVPRLNIKINDSSHYLPKNNQEILHYYDTQQEFYFYNRQDGRLKDIAIPTGLTLTDFSASLTHGDFSLVKKGLSDSSDITRYRNIFGSQKPGIYRFSTLANDVSRFNQFLSSEIESSTSGSISFDLEWYWFKEGNTPEKRIIKSEKIDFNIPENEDFTEKNIISKITTNNFNLIANDTIQKLSVFFIDTKKQYVANKKPFEVKCENLGEVHIKVIDTYDGSTLIDIDNQKNSTQLYFNGKDYEYDLFTSSILKDRTVRFEFVIVDEITDTLKIIKDNTKIKVL